MSFRDSVKDNTKSVMIQTFITSLFSDPHMRFGDILEDLIETDDPDDDWMRETLYDLEIGQLVRAGAKVMGLNGANGLAHDSADLAEAYDDDGIAVTEDDDGIEHSLPGSDESSEEPEGKPKKKKKKKKKTPTNAAEAPTKKKKKKKKKQKPQSVPTRRSKDAEEASGDSEWRDYLKLVIKALRAHKAYDSDTAVNNGVILNQIHGEENWDKDESADLRRAMDELGKIDKVDKVGQRRGTRYHLN